MAACGIRRQIDFIEKTKAGDFVLKHIRPYQLFTLLDRPAPERVANVKIPNRKDLALLETFLLITALRLVNARRVFEFGTYFGSTTLNLALNSSPDSEIFTLDLEDSDLIRVCQLSADAVLTQEHLAREMLDFEQSNIANKIVCLKGNSHFFDFSPFKNSIDLIFIDGGHDYETVASDTRNAFKMLRMDTHAAIFWHDYGHPQYLDNTRFLDELSAQYDVFHVEDTMLCGYLSNSGIDF